MRKIFQVNDRPTPAENFPCKAGQVKEKGSLAIVCKYRWI